MGCLAECAANFARGLSNKEASAEVMDQVNSIRGPILNYFHKCFQPYPFFRGLYKLLPISHVLYKRLQSHMRIC